jgi:predicted aspartyl protease
MKKHDFLFLEGVPYIYVVFYAQEKFARYLFIIDTGASDTSISLKIVTKLGLHPDKSAARSSKKVATASKFLYPETVTLDSLEALGLKRKNCQVNIIDFPDHTAGVIGNDFLEQLGKIKIHYDTKIIEAG